MTLAMLAGVVCARAHPTTPASVWSAPVGIFEKSVNSEYDHQAKTMDGFLWIRDWKRWEIELMQMHA